MKANRSISTSSLVLQSILSHCQVVAEAIPDLQPLRLVRPVQQLQQPLPHPRLQARSFSYRDIQLLTVGTTVFSAHYGTISYFFETEYVTITVISFQCSDHFRPHFLSPLGNGSKVGRDQPMENADLSSSENYCLT